MALVCDDQSVVCRAVVFDLFHTLVDTEHVRPAGFVASAEVADLVGVDRGEFADFWAETYVERESTMLDLVDLTTRFCDHVGLSVTAAQRNRIDELFGMGKDDALLHPRPDVVAMVATTATRAHVAVLSNCHLREVRGWPRSPLAEHVSVFARSCEIGFMKPDVRSYEWVLDRLGVPAAEASYVGNGASDELVGARNAGFGRVVHCNVFDSINGLVPVDEQQRRAAHADVSVDTIAQLSAAIDACLYAGPR